MKKVIRGAWASLVVVAMSWPLVVQAQTKPAKEPTAAQLAARERMQKCSAEWKETKAAGKAEPGMKWPKFWSACNARLKGGAKA